jgi:hypothetical protein
MNTITYKTLVVCSLSVFALTMALDAQNSRRQLKSLTRMAMGVLKVPSADLRELILPSFAILT